MTFKHIKFEDSEVMRSLEKVGVSKGIVKPAAPTKSIHELLESRSSAAVSGNLTQDIVKLCQKLRKEGFESYASEIESKFVAFKKADSLYQTSKEKGDDLIDAAHPKGSHKLEGVLGDAVVETVIDRHLAFLNVLDKKPTGKLASKDIVNALKYALGEGAVPEILDDDSSDKKEQEMDGYRQSIATRYLVGASRVLDKCAGYINENLAPGKIDDEGLGFIKDLKDLILKLVDVDTKQARVKITLDKIDSMLPVADKLIQDINDKGYWQEERRDQRKAGAQIASKAKAQISTARSIIAKQADDTVIAVKKQEAAQAAKVEAERKAKSDKDTAAQAETVDKEKLKEYTAWYTGMFNYSKNELGAKYPKQLEAIKEKNELNINEDLDMKVPAQKYNSASRFMHGVFVKKVDEIIAYFANQKARFDASLTKLNAKSTDEKLESWTDYQKSLDAFKANMEAKFTNYTTNTLNINTFTDQFKSNDPEAKAALTPTKAKAKADDGKVSKAADIIRAVKMALAGDELDENQKAFVEKKRKDFARLKLTEFKTLLSTAEMALGKLTSLTSTSGFAKARIQKCKTEIDAFNVDDPTFQILEDINLRLYRISKYNISPIGSPSEDEKNAITAVDNARFTLSHVSDALKGKLTESIWNTYKKDYEKEKKQKDDAAAIEASQKRAASPEGKIDAFLSDVNQQIKNCDIYATRADIVFESLGPKAQEKIKSTESVKKFLSGLKTKLENAKAAVEGGTTIDDKMSFLETSNTTLALAKTKLDKVKSLWLNAEELKKQFGAE